MIIVVDFIRDLPSLDNNLQIFSSFISTDNRDHPNQSSISVLYFSMGTENSSYIIPINHIDKHPRSDITVDSIFHWIMSSSDYSSLFVSNSKKWRQYFSTKKDPTGDNIASKLIDVDIVGYLSSGKVSMTSNDISSRYSQYYSKFFNSPGDINTIIPIGILSDYLHTHTQSIRNEYDENNQLAKERNITQVSVDGYGFYFNKIIPVATWLEFDGIHIDLTKISNQSDSLLYPQYHLYNKTGRWSNNFGGINFSAIPKNSNLRKAMTSRFGDDGMIVLIDYEAFHPRLISTIIGNKFPNDISVYEFIKRSCFEDQSITVDQAKIKTLQMLYGNDVEPELKDEIGFFSKVHELKNSLWDEYKKNNGWILSPKSLRPIYIPMTEKTTPSFIFSYWVQALEMEWSVGRLEMVKNYPYNKKLVKLLLYTYDSILLDISKKGDYNTAITEIVSLLSNLGEFPMRVYTGTSYDNVVYDDRWSNL